MSYQEIDTLKNLFKLYFDDSAKGNGEREVRSSLNSAALQQFLSKEPNFNMSQKLERTWCQFTFVDAMAHVGFFVGIQTDNWNLRTSSITNFSAFDHGTYVKLISDHNYIRSVETTSHIFSGSICGKHYRQRVPLKAMKW